MFCTARLITYLTKLGFATNWEKSAPILHQQALYVGVVLDADAMRATLSESRRAALLRAVHRLRQGATVTALTVMQTLGVPARVIAYVPSAEVVFQPTFGSQEAQTAAGNHPPLSGGQPPVVGVSGSPLEGVSTGTGDLLHHSVHGCIQNRMGRDLPEEGYRGALGSTESRHSNLLELRAVVLVLRPFRPLCQEGMLWSEATTAPQWLISTGRAESAPPPC